MAATPSLKSIVDAALRSLLERLQREVGRMQAISGELLRIRDAVRRPVAEADKGTRPADAAECAVTMRQYAVWCGRHGGSPTKSLTRLMRIAMSSDTPQAVHPVAATMDDKTSFASRPPSEGDRHAA